MSRHTSLRGAQDSDGLSLNFAPLLCLVPVRGFAGRTDPRRPRSTGIPCLAALQAFVQSDYVHVLTLRKRIRNVVAHGQSPACASASKKTCLERQVHRPRKTGPLPARIHVRPFAPRHDHPCALRRAFSRYENGWLSLPLQILSGASYAVYRGPGDAFIARKQTACPPAENRCALDPYIDVHTRVG